MTSVVGLRFVVTGEAEAIAALERYKAGLSTLGQAQRRSATAFSQRVASETQSIRRQDAEARKAFQNLLRYEREKEQAAARAARAVEQAAQQEARAQRQAAQETARLAAETEALARAYNPAMAASSVYEREVQQLNRAHQLGVLSADAFEAKLQELQTAYARSGSSAKAAQAFTNQFGSGAHLAGIKTNRFGMVAQQVGYQVGDFFVQVQSGTNAFVAFGQQATQLAGLLPGLAGAIVGISISVGTMLLAAYDRTRRAAQDFEDTTFDINEAAKSATDELKKYREELAKLTSEYETLGEIGLDKQIKSLDAELRNLEGRRAAITGAAATGFGAAGGMMSGADLEGMVGDALRANTEEINEQIRSKREQLRLLMLERESVEAVKIQLGEQNRLLKDGAAATLARNTSFRQSRLELEREIDLLQLSTQYGEDSVEVARQRAYYEAVMLGYTEEQRNAYIDLVLKVREQRDALHDTHNQTVTNLRLQEAQARRLDEQNTYIEQMADLFRNVQEAQRQVAINAAQTYQTNEEYVKSVAEAFRTMENLREEIGDAAYEALRLAGVDMASGIDAAARNAAILAGNLGVSLERAIGIMRLKAQVGQPEEVIFDPRDPRYDPIAAEMARNKPGTVSPFDPSRLPKLPSSGRSGGGGGGGGAAREQEDYLKNLLLEAEHKRRLVGLTEEQTRRQELLFDLEKRKLPIDEERIEQIIRVEAETRALMALEEQRMQLMQTVEGHIENAFMSFVQGSATVEEAFKGMLRNIILAIYQQQVAEPAARAVGGLLGKVIPALFSANGNVFSGGAHVTAYANGGVVNSPTMFQHSGGLGVMGEAGPEAIMPLKRGANGKLGVQMEGASGGNVTVNQYFQVSANGDESVRRIVRQEAPRMAEMAKSAVVDAKRRGGSYGRSF